MISINFTTAVNFTLGQEGGFTDNPADPGGATNKGITLATLGLVIAGANLADLKKLTDHMASSIYWSQYWNPVAGDKLPAGIDLMVFDMAVNAGVAASAKLLQACVGATEDGIIGSHTLASIAATTNLLPILGAAQMRYYLGLSDFSTFGRGWTNRVFARIVAAAHLSG